MNRPARLGAFELHELVSTGGMGQVWRGVHAETQTRVAVKVIAEALAADPVYLDGFEREVQAVASLDHARIVTVYDYGFVDGRAAQSSHGQLSANSPWLAMEYAALGSLADCGGIRDFATLRSILFDILDALAHSHARGIIHRDLKPGNVLLVETDSGIFCKLTDFGIAHASHRSLSTREVFASSAGTPWYMAPEQIDSRWRDYGPWTDLYALGCVAFQLACGVTPFVGNTVVEVARQQLFEQPPPLSARFECPPGFEAWVSRLLVKEIPHRFRRAADAAWALEQLSPNSERVVSLGAKKTRREDVDTVAETLPLGIDATQTVQTPADGVRHAAVSTLTFLEGEASAATDPLRVAFTGAPSSTTPDAPPLPSSWRPGLHRTAEPLQGAGLGLFGLREVPFVDRVRERDHIWRLLCEVATSRRRRVVVIRGEPGIGKSRLARWMAQRCHELGATTNLEASHSPVGGPGHGIGRMLEKHLGCVGLDVERTYARVRQVLSQEMCTSPELVEQDAAAVTRLIRPSERSHEVPPVRFASPEERHRIIERVIAHAASARPALLVLDDAQWGYDTMEFVRYLLARQSVDASPLLFLLTIDDHSLAARPLEAETLEAICRDESATQLILSPLDEPAHDHLLDGMLAVEPPLRRRIFETTHGVPLFTIQLVGDWIERGRLRPTAQGFALVDDEVWPDDVHQIWRARLESVLRELDADPAQAQRALEIAAALGRYVHDTEWRQVCTALEVPISSQLVEALATRGLVRRTEDGFEFSHFLLRESLLRTARSEGRASAHHRSIAGLLEGELSTETLIRCSRHFLEADVPSLAIEPLMAATAGLLESSQLREAGASIAHTEEVFRRAALPPSSARWGELSAHKAQLAQSLGRFDEMMEAAEAALEHATRHDWPQIASQAHRLISSYWHVCGDLERAEHHLERAIAIARELDEPMLEAAALSSSGLLLILKSRLQESRVRLLRARQLCQRANNERRAAYCSMALGDVARLRGDLAHAADLHEEAAHVFRRIGDRYGLAASFNGRADVARAAGDHAAAKEYLEQALELCDLVGHFQGGTVRFNLGLLEFADRHIPHAEHWFLEALRMSRAQSSQILEYFCQVGLAACAALRGQPEQWDRRFAGLRALGVQGVHEPDLAAMIEEAAHAFAETGDGDRTKTALQMAIALSRPGDERHERLARRMSQLQLRRTPSE